jgi:hypothetical protein
MPTTPTKRRATARRRTTTTPAKSISGIEALAANYPSDPISDDAGVLDLVKSEYAPHMAFPVVITPALAQNLLDLNMVNRKRRGAKVTLWASIMSSGGWELNGETICFASGGLMLNGQHRLAACVQANVPFHTFIVVGLDESVRWTFDTGTKRNFADVLDMEKYQNTSLLASTSGWCFRYENGAKLSTNNKSHGNVQHSTMLEWLEANPGLVDVVAWVKSAGLPDRKGVTQTMWAGMIYEAKGNEEVAKEFASSFAKKVGWYEGHPALTLHNWVEKKNTGKEENRPAAIYFNAALVKAYNAFAQGKDMRHIVIKPRKKKDGSESKRYAEDFPHILTADDLT